MKGVSRRTGFAKSRFELGEAGHEQNKRAALISSSHKEGLQLFLLDSGDGERLLRLEGELDLASAPRLRETLEALEDRGLVVDLSGLAFMDSTGLAALLERWKRRATGAGDMRIRGARGQTLSLLTRTGTLALFTDPGPDVAGEAGLGTQPEPRTPDYG